MANPNARFKEIKQKSREVETLQKNVAEKFRKMENALGVGSSSASNGFESVSEEIEDLQDQISNLPTAQGMVLGTYFSNTSVPQNTSYGSVAYASSKIVEIGFVAANGSQLLFSSGTQFRLYRNGVQISSLDLSYGLNTNVACSSLKVYDLSPTGGSVTYSLRNFGGGTVYFSNLYLYAKEV